ncbi:unnamed protein product [Urochloa decumbens]|uniref:Uncharacterized protein n=1 Tax=Urochloa decumbens TaxID=240449 RepID=A0ABC9EQE3_9POAL
MAYNTFTSFLFLFRNSSTNQEDTTPLSRGLYLLHQESLAKKQHLIELLAIPTNIVVPARRASTDCRQQQEQADQAPVAVAMMKPQVVKKQARRRTHTSRPYQERLLNMAEARREIVAALKIHRANSRHQPCPSSYHHQQPPPLQHQEHFLKEQQQQQQQVQVMFQDNDPSQAAPPAPTIMSYTSFADHQLSNPVAGSCYSPPPPVLPYDLTQLDVPMPTTAMGGYGLGFHGFTTGNPGVAERQIFVECQIGGTRQTSPLPSAQPLTLGERQTLGEGVELFASGLPARPLGLNLSFQGFLDGAKDHEDDLFGGVPVMIQSASPAAASSYSATTETGSGGTHGSPALSGSTVEKYSSPADLPALTAPPVLDDGGREAQSSAGGETTQGVEWSGEATTAAEDVAAASAWWSKILLESVESGGGGEVAAADGLPAEWRRWLCDDGVGEQGAVTGGDKTPDVLETKQLADGDGEEGVRRSDGGGDGVALPCMDDDIEGWDGEWFSCSS